MPSGVGFLFVAVVLIALGSQMITYRHLWPVVRRGWAGMDSHRRRHMVIAALAEFAFAAAILAIAIAAPWGSRTLAYVILGIAAIVIPVLLLGTVLQARRDIRAARERRRESKQAPGE
jgi:cation transport ATPase